MPELLIENSDEILVQCLERLAEINYVTVEKTAVDLLNDAVERAEFLHDFIITTKKFAASLPPQTTDSTNLIREMRDAL